MKIGLVSIVVMPIVFSRLLAVDAYALEPDSVVGMWLFDEDTDAKGNVTDENWHHIAATYDGKTTRVYIDGTLGTENELGGDPDTHDGEISIGALANGTWPILGIVDEVGLFREALSETEIQNIMTNGLLHRSYSRWKLQMGFLQHGAW